MKLLPWMRTSFFVLFGFLVLSLAFFAFVSSGKRVAAASGCNVVLSIDRSISIGPSLSGMQTNIKGIFQQLGTDFAGKGIRLGFWTFSQDADPNSTDYNKYAIGFTPVDGGSPTQRTAFNHMVDDITLDGQTNYEQALSYNNGIANSNSVVAGLRTGADVVAIITDGIPNFPGDEDPDDSSPLPSPAEMSARAAVNSFKQDNLNTIDPDMLGFVLNNVSNLSMNYMLNGDKHVNTDANGVQNVGPFDYSNGTITRLAQKIGEACDKRTPTGYSLVPQATATTTAVRSGSSTSVNYGVTMENNLTGGPVTSGWSVMRIVVKPGGNENAICSNANKYCDNMSCATVALALGSSMDSCVLAPDGTNTCATGCKQYSQSDGQYEPLLMRSEKIPDGLELGTKVCFVLALTGSPATGKSNPRYGVPACVMIGKSPTVQVWGGDVRVGRPFIDDNSGDITPANSGVYTSIFGMPDSKTYGSWAEYGVFAPSTIKSMASMSGLAEGYMGAASGTTGDAACDTPALNRLTFANVVLGPSDTCGKYGSMGAIPNVVATYTAWNAVSPSLLNTAPIDANKSTGRYEMNPASTGTVHLSATTIDPGKQIVFDFRGRDVVIDGDIRYADQKGPGPSDTYKDLSDVPQLIIIANNITISASVKNIDAWLIANGHATTKDGTVKTCVPNATAPFVTASMCNDQLRVNGPIMARYLELWRTYGAEDGDSDCDKDASTPDCSDAKNPAEVIDLPGTTLMWSALNSGKKRALTTYSVELPPYF